MSSDPFPPNLQKLAGLGRVVPVVGDSSARSSDSEHLDLLKAVTSLECRAVISLSPLSAGRDVASGQGWHIKSRTSVSYDPDSKVWIALGQGAGDKPDGRLDPTYWVQLADSEPYLWEAALAFAARDSLLVVDCDPADIVSRGLVRSLRPRTHFFDGGWIVWHGPIDPEVRSAWKDMGFELIGASLPATIEALHSLRTGLDPIDFAPDRDEPGDRGGSPYKLLHYYDVADRRFFFGRESEIERLVNMIGAYPLVVVTGASGAGKTSLLNAGVLSWFARNPPYEGFYVRFRDDPLGSFEEALGAGGKSGRAGDGNDEEAIYESLVKIVAERRIIPILIFDQFEELFVRFSKVVQDRFWRLIRSCLMSREIPIRFIVVIREDYLGQLAGMRRNYPAVLQNTFYVPALSGAKARDAMVEPARRAGIQFDETLAWQIVHELEQRSAVSAPELQIVCDALFRASLDGVINRDVYDATGGTAKILATFMNGELARRGSDFEARATSVLKALVTSDETKENLGVGMIARRAKLGVGQVASILRTLRDDCRFVRKLPGEDEVFELSHDYLAPEISSWMTSREKEERRAHDLLDRELRAWKQFRSIRLGPDRLIYFHDHVYGELLDQDGLLYLLLSSVRHLEPADRWIEGVLALGPREQSEIAHKLFDFFEDAEMATRREAAEVIGLLDTACVIEAITSSKVSRRAAAIEMAGGLRLAAAVEPLLACARDRDADEGCRVLACGALSELIETRGDLVADFLKLESADPSEPVRCAAIVALGKAADNPDAFARIDAAIRSESIERSRAGLAAVRQGRTGAFIERVVKEGHYEDLADEVKDDLWELLLRMTKAEGSATAKEILPKLGRGDLLRYNYNEWRQHWLYRILIDEFCRRYPKECHTEKTDYDRINAMLERFDYSIEHAQKMARAGHMDHLISHIKKGYGDRIIVGEFLRDLVTSSESRFRISALRMASNEQAKTGFLDNVRRYIPAAKVRSLLASGNPTERYWAALATGYLEYRDNTELLREMSSDHAVTSVYDGTVGIRVQDAVAYTLNRLAPISAIWRKEWQSSFGADAGH